MSYNFLFSNYTVKGVSKETLYLYLGVTSNQNEKYGIIFVFYCFDIIDPQYQDMFEEGNFRRRKRMRRHAYKSPGIGFKSWPNLTDTHLLYRNTYPFMYPSVAQAR